MEKCWFVFSQKYFEPPKTFKTNEGKYTQSGSLCLGDLFEKPAHFSPRVNTHHVEFPLGNDIRSNESGKLMWNTDENGERSLNVSFDAPVAQALGLTVGAKLIAALKHSGHHYSSIESLEAITVDTSLSSLRSILNTEGTPEYIASQTSAGISNWNLYMITGVIVARGSKTIIQEGSRQKEYGFNTSASGSEIGAMKVQGRDFAQNTDSRLRDGIGDYVWAVRLMKITKRWFNRTWHPETFGVGAVFGTDGDAQSVDVDGIIHAENMRAAGMLHTESGGTFVLLQPREETS